MSINSRVQAGQFGSLNNAGRRRKLASPIVLVKGPAQGLEHTADRALDAVQKNITNAVQQTASGPLASAAFFQNVQLPPSERIYTLVHGLGRTFSSVLMCGQATPGVLVIQRPAPISRPLSNQNRLDALQVMMFFAPLSSAFNGVGCLCDILVW